MNSFQTLEIDQIIKQISEYAVTSGGLKEVESLQMMTHRLNLQRELNRQREALEATIYHGAPSFSGVHDIVDSAILASKGGVLSIEKLVHVGQFGHGIQSLKSYYQKATVELERLSDLFENLVSDVELSQEIDRCFSRDFEVYDDASPTLASIRRQMNALESRISNTIQTFIQKNSAYLTDTFSTIRSDRTVLPVKTSEKHRFKGIIHNQSASGQTTFVEPQILIDLNNERQSLVVDEHQEIQRICRDLSRRLARISDQYIASHETVSLLDSLFARAKWANERDGIVATLSENQIILKGARHPLLDQQTVVPNNYVMEPPTRLLLITGPNTGGKTVGLKTIGTCVYLSHCGIPVLCNEAVVPYVDNIFVDIGDRQSIEQNLSTFSAHIQSLKIVIDQATEKSLVLLDELGVGTDPVEGESLAQAIIENLLAKKSLTVATTHYSRLKLMANEHDTIMNASVEFDVETLRPTYRFITGIAGQSYALDIASRLEINQEVIDRAIQLKEQTVSEQETLVENLEQEILMQKQVNEQLVEERKQTENMNHELASKLSQLENEKSKLLEEHKQKLQVQFNTYNKQAREILEKTREKEKSHEVLDAIQELKQLEPELQVEEEVIENDYELKVGDMVRIVGTQQVGTITEINKQQAILDVRGLRMTVKLNQLQYHKPTKTKKKQPQKRSSVSVVASTSMALEVNVIGKRVDEAISEINAYLDQAVLNKLKTGRIIHGHGTGALRNATHELLRRHKAVKDFRLGGENEGGVGATVVTFK